MPPQRYTKIPEALNGYGIFPTRSAFNITVPEDTINYFLSPSFENADNDTETNSANVTPSYSTAWSWRGRYSRLITISSTAANYFAKRATAATGFLDTAGNSATFSCYVYSPASENFQLEVRSSLDAFAAAIITKTFKATGGSDRFWITFQAPSGTAAGTIYEFRVVRTNATTNPYYTDGWQLEQKSYPTTYCDGDQSGCVWLGTQANAYSKRPIGVAGGRTYNFNDPADPLSLGIIVKGHQGFGLPPVPHSSQKRALQGGEFYQRSIPSLRVGSIVCVLMERTIQAIQARRETLEAFFAPYLLQQQAKPLLLTYQLYDDCGKPVGKAIDLACLYLGGLEGNTDNNHLDTFTLQFIEYTPPSMQEQRELNSVPSFQGSDSAGTYAIHLRQALNKNDWIATAGTGINAAYQTSADGIYVTAYANTVSAYTTPYKVGTGTVVSWATTGGGTNALAGTRYDTDLWAGGSFATINATPANFIAHQTALNTWAALAAGGPNSTVNALLFEPGGKLYVAGAFTTPNNRLTRYNPATAAWESIGGTGLSGTANALALGLNGNIYVGGSFATANGITVNNIAQFNPTTGLYSALGTGLDAGVQSIVTGLDGKIYAGGSFTTASGITVNRIAVWNGNQWSALGAGLNNTVVSMSIMPNGALLAVGFFTATSDGAVTFPSHAAIWSGSQWLPLSISYTDSFTICVRANNQGDILIGHSSPGSATTYEKTTTINYAGSADTRPKVIIRGPGTLYQIANLTTGAALYFNYTLQAGEVATLTTDPSNLTFTSNFFGNVLGKILPGSNLVNFGLVPGNNDLSCYIGGTTSGTTAIELYYNNRHWSFDASGGTL